jgi:hypothetical protein
MGGRARGFHRWSAGKFPNLKENNSAITSNNNNYNYNCIAWAAGRNDEWWWPDENHREYWPPKVPRKLIVSAFVQAFGTVGYVRCKNSNYDEGFEKIAIYASKAAKGKLVPEHAARQLIDGRWTSKMGLDEDIEHLTVNDVAGPAYGRVVCYMRRPC